MIEMNAIHRLCDGELCFVVAGEHMREAIWDEQDQQFYFTDDGELGCNHELT